MEENRPPAKRNPIIIGIVLIGLGLLFIIGRFVDFGGIGRLWPLFMFIPVAALSATLIKDPKNHAGALIPITILTFLGVYFLWLNYTDWSRVAQTWPNFIIAPGLGVLASWLITRERSQLASAVVILILGTAMYARIIMSNLGMRVDRFVLLGILLILGGITVVVVSHRKNRRD